MMSDKEKGLYPKYYVAKIIESPQGVFDSSVKLETVKDWVFVLNPRTDPIARFALLAYAVSAERRGYKQLGADIRAKLKEYED